MSAHATTEQLEALIREELSAQQRAVLEAHVQGCARCQQELTWLRAERSLFERRPREPLPAGLWQGIEARLPSQPAAAPRLSALSAVPSGENPRARERTQKWFALAAAAALLIGFSVGGFPLAGLRQKLLLGLQGRSSLQAGVTSVHNADGDADSDERSAVLKVSAPVLVKVKTTSAEIEAVAGQRDQVRAVVDNSSVKAVELRTEGNGDVRVLFDQREGLLSGRIHLELPPGSRIEVNTASGEVSIREVGGDVTVRTASGGVTVHGGRKLDIETASGDISVEEFGGEGRIRTVSGDTRLKSTSAPLSQIDVTSTSGELSLEGTCAAGCRVTVNTVSGDVELHTRGERSHQVEFHSQSGDLSGLEATASGDENQGTPKEYRLRFGAGAGTINVTTVSGDLGLEHS